MAKSMHIGNSFARSGENNYEMFCCQLKFEFNCVLKVKTSACEVRK